MKTNITILPVILIGAGVLFIASAMDCSDIPSTFQKIISGQKIDWTGGNCKQQPVQGNPAVVGGGKLINPNSDGSCPKGYTSVTVSGGKLMCQAPTP